MAAIPYPFTNKELSTSDIYRGKDHFFNLAEVILSDDGTFHIHVHPDLPLVTRNDLLRDQVNSTSTDVRKVLSRNDIKNQNHQLGDNVRTLGAGVFPWILMADRSERLILLQKDKNAPSAALAYMQPAGLVSGEHPLLTMFREAMEETCLLSVDDKTETLTVHSFLFPNNWEDEACMLSNASMLIAKDHSLPHIYNNIAQHHPEYTGYHIQFSTQPLPSVDVQDSKLNTAVFHLPDGSIYTLKGMVCDDSVSKSLDFSRAIKIDMSDFPIVKNVDPESFGRRPKLATRAEIHSLERVTAPLQHYRETMTVAPDLTKTSRLEPEPRPRN